MAKAKMSGREKIEAARLEEFRLQQRSARIQTLKTVGIIILCIALVFAFCVPAISLLFSQ